MKHQSTEKHPLITPLNQALANAIALKLQAKQAHWNIKGPNFIALHELFDKVAGAVDAHADTIAERVVQLGGIAEGTLQYVGDATTLDAYPINIQDEQAHVKALSHGMSCFTDGMRQLIAESAEAKDDVTEDICIGITREMDMLYWFVSAHVSP